MKKWTVMVVGMLLLGLILAGCGSPKPAGELRIAIETLGNEAGDPSLDMVANVRLLAPQFDYLVGATPEGVLSKELGLAYDWQVSHGPTSSTYTIYIREGVKFHNGDELTAEDVEFSLNYYQRTESQAVQVSVLRTYIDRIEIIDSYKLVVHTTVPYGMLLNDLSPAAQNLGMVLPKKYIEENGEAHFNANPIGTGPYRFKERSLGASVTFEAVDNHWRIGVPKYETLTYKLIPEAGTRIAALKSGEVDIISLSRERIPEVSQDFGIFVKPDANIVQMWLQVWHPDSYLYDKGVREALNLAIDREEIIDSLLAGQGSPTSIGFYGSWALDYEAPPPYPYDPERARQLLNEAFPEGVTITINSIEMGGVPELKRIQEAVGGYWSAVGVEVNLNPSDLGTQANLVKLGQAEDIVSGMVAANRPSWSSLNAVAFKPDGLYCLVKDPVLTDLIDATGEEIEPSKIAQGEAEVARYIRDNHYMVAIAEVGVTWAGNPDKVPADWNLGKLSYDINLDALVRK